MLKIEIGPVEFIYFKLYSIKNMILCNVDKNYYICCVFDCNFFFKRDKNILKEIN